MNIKVDKVKMTISKRKKTYKESVIDIISLLDEENFN